MRRREDLLPLTRQAAARLTNIPDIQAESVRTSHGWSAKEVLGHLIDSAANNHQRIVRLLIHPVIEFPDYQRDNDAWLRCQRYQARPWKELLELWRGLNLHLAHVIAQIPHEAEPHVWRQTEGDMPLGDLVDDYVRHLGYHLGQLTSLLGLEKPE